MLMSKNSLIVQQLANQALFLSDLESGHNRTRRVSRLGALG